MDLPILTTGLILTFVISYLSIPLLSKWAHRHGLGDVGGERHQHQGFIPVTGGIGFFFALLAGWVFYTWNTENYLHLDIGIYAFFAGMMVIHLAGVADDIWRITPTTKFLASATAAALFVFTNPVFKELYFPFFGTVELGIFAPVFSLIWIIGLINAINLIDGIDGLAGGVSAIILCGIAFFAFYDGDFISLSIALFLIAGLLGFLVHNFPPAKVFMGDGGSLVLGFVIGTLPQRVVAFENGFVNFLILISLLLLPFMDTANAFIRRMLQGRSPFRPDKEHFHHRIIALGANPGQTMAILWSATLLFVLISIKMYFSNDFEVAIWFLLEMVIVIAAINRLGYLEIRHKKFLPKWKFANIQKYDNPPIIFRKIFHRVLLLITDYLAVNLALWLYLQLKMAGQPIYNPAGDITLPVVGDFASQLLSIFWIGLLYLNNLYDLTWDTPRVDRMFSLSKVTFFGIIVLSMLVLDISVFDTSRLINLFLYWIALTFLLITFRLMLIALERKFRVLEYSGKNTLAIGCTDKFKEILADSKSKKGLYYNIIGCIDKEDNEETLGKIADLPRLIHHYRIEELIITGSVSSQDEIFDIIAATENLGIHYKVTPDLSKLISGLKKENIFSYPLIRLQINDLLPWQKVMKRLSDLLISFLYLTLAVIPVILYSFYLLIREGSVWRKEIVIGRYGRPFYLYKWISEINQKNKLDRLFHHYYLNKFSFFIAIILNQLSLVGPQIQSWVEVKKRVRVRPYYRRRFVLKPGIIGPSQLASILKGEKLSLEAELEKDRQYLEEISITNDIKIMINSLSLIIFNILRRK